MNSRLNGFSLVEVVLALGIFATVGLALIGLLGSGMNVARDALNDAEITMLVENVQARLTLDPNWPGQREIIYYDNSGVEVEDEKAAVFRVTLNEVPGPGFNSDYLDTLRVAIDRLPHGQKAGTWMLHRTRLAHGRPHAKR